MVSREAVALPLKKRVLRGRRLIVVDIENLVGGAGITQAQAAAAHRCVTSAVAMRPGEQVIIGTSHVGLLSSGIGWRGPRMVVRSGKDGADLALLEVLKDEHIEERFDEVVIVSGDGIFTDAVLVLREAGVFVTVVSRNDACSKRLRLAADQTVLVDMNVGEFGGVA
ncbi:NYN domain-containing protein [Nocardioides marmorisolisilvae]|uniref:NYN domain-containing protein n=1 Tax=Nocardioides marmorisolisilvae TaxID=1542737 RepID=A0A3N0DS76_9ACTN|nr:NYN domain-containing protein [Nocardioides marmorisolisilvae]RNL78479.1 NYN domain-containing protein [Nocardioides marmorisolisilvae]